MPAGKGTDCSAQPSVDVGGCNESVELAASDGRALGFDARRVLKTTRHGSCHGDVGCAANRADREGRTVLKPGESPLIKALLFAPETLTEDGRKRAQDALDRLRPVALGLAVEVLGDGGKSSGDRLTAAVVLAQAGILRLTAS